MSRFSCPECDSSPRENWKNVQQIGQITTKLAVHLTLKDLKVGNLSVMQLKGDINLALVTLFRKQGAEPYYLSLNLMTAETKKLLTNMSTHNRNFNVTLKAKHRTV